MKLIIVTLSVLTVLFVYLFVRELKRRKALQVKYDKADEMLTRYIADNIDLDKQLQSIRYDYELAKEMSKEIGRVQEQSRRLKHDMKNHTMVMLSYFEENRIEEAKAYAGEILDKLNKMYTYVNVGNALLNYIINNKLSKAKEDGIEIKAEIENLPFDYVESVDFSALLNNMLDNAITAALLSSKKKMEVSIRNSKGMDIITVKNSIDSSVLMDNPDFISTKDEPGHGFGIKQIRTITKKYSGDIDIYEKDEMFVVSVVLGMSFVTE